MTAKKTNQMDIILAQFSKMTLLQALHHTTRGQSNFQAVLQDSEGSKWFLARTTDSLTITRLEG